MGLSVRTLINLNRCLLDLLNTFALCFVNVELTVWALLDPVHKHTMRLRASPSKPLLSPFVTFMSDGVMRSDDFSKAGFTKFLEILFTP